MIQIFTLDGCVNLKKDTLMKLSEFSPKIKLMIDETLDEKYMLDDCLKDELVNVIMSVISKRILKNNDQSLLFLNETCEKFGISILTLNLSCDLLLLYLEQIHTKQNINSPTIKIARSKYLVNDINSNYFDKSQDKLILKIKSAQYVCTIQKDANNSYLLSETDYHVIKHKYKPPVTTEQFENQFAELFAKALKYPPMYYEKIIEQINKK